MKHLEWPNCYDDNWNGLIVPDAFAHPAKFSHGLIRRIFTFMLQEGMVCKGDRVADPFGGIGTGGIVAASMGLQWFGCELEAKFHELGLRNFDLHLMTWQTCGDPVPVLVNEDSRKLRENLRLPLAQAVVSSPPFAESLSSGTLSEAMKAEMASRGHKPSASGEAADYGSTPGQLGAMKAGDVSAVVSSPPYAEQVIRASGRELGDHKQGATAGGHCFDTYGDTPGNVANLPAGNVEAVVSSPPYEGSLHLNESQDVQTARLAAKGNFSAIEKMSGASASGNHGYGASDGNLGNDKGETFWHAARDIVRECYAILRPAGWSAWVVKDFVRNKARVPFCDDWCKLLKACGFTVEIRVHAMLVKETSHPDLFGGDDHVERTERKSFFRRLAEKKGSPRIDWEEVVFARKAL